MRVTLANLITVSRIPLSLMLLFFPAFSTRFYICYLAAGLTDMIDGTAARLSGTASSFGARLDTAADTIFAVCGMISILPALTLPVWIWIGTAAVMLVKTVSVIRGFAVNHEFTAKHTLLNKAAGFLLFLFPLTSGLIDVNISAAVLLVITMAAAVHESFLIKVKN